MTAEYKVVGDVALITLANPPVNGLGFATRVGITDGLDKANADDAVKSIVITGAGKAFSGGADIKEFGTPKAAQEPNLGSVILALEASQKPIVAAIHSVVMGGGLELALGCHYRVVASARRLSGVPSNTMLPWPMTSARSEMCIAIVSFCSIRSTEMPLSLSVLRYWPTSSTILGARPSVGSSMMIRSGRP